MYLIQHYVIKFVSGLRSVRGFFPGTPVSSTNKTDCHDITEILLKVALDTITLANHKKLQIVHITGMLHQYHNPPNGIASMSHTHGTKICQNVWLRFPRLDLSVQFFEVVHTNAVYVVGHYCLVARGRHGCDRMVVGFTYTCAISA